MNGEINIYNLQYHKNSPDHRLKQNIPSKQICMKKISICKMYQTSLQPHFFQIHHHGMKHTLMAL